MRFHINGKNPISLESYTLVVPCVAVGNVGQLACDLLVHSLAMKKAGIFVTECVLPLVGPDPYRTEDNSSMTFSLELFIDEERKLAALQQRAPIVPGKLSEFNKELVNWISQQNVTLVIMLTSCHAYERKDHEISGPNVQYLITSGDELHSELQDEKIHELKPRKTEFGTEVYYLPGGGIARFFQHWSVENKPQFSSVILMIFCSEGDNIPESLTLLNAVNDWKGFYKFDKKAAMPWKIPASWKYLFGSRQPRSIF